MAQSVAFHVPVRVVDLLFVFYAVTMTVPGALRQRAEALHEDDRPACQGPQSSRQVAAEVQEPSPESTVDAEPRAVGRQPIAVCRCPVHGSPDADGHAGGHARAKCHGHAATFLPGLDRAAVPRAAGCIRGNDGYSWTLGTGTVQQWVCRSRRDGSGSGRRETTDVNPRHPATGYVQVSIYLLLLPCLPSTILTAVFQVKPVLFSFILLLFLLSVV